MFDILTMNVNELHYNYNFLQIRILCTALEGRKWVEGLKLKLWKSSHDAIPGEAT